MVALIERIKQYLGKYVRLEYCYDVEQTRNRKYRRCRKIAGLLKEVGDDYIALTDIDDLSNPYEEMEKLIKLSSIIAVSSVFLPRGREKGGGTTREGFEEEFGDV
ncbi:MAG: hypothetical protein QXZ56_07885 [Sulfolobales archaeon]